MRDSLGRYAILWENSPYKKKNYEGNLVANHILYSEWFKGEHYIYGYIEYLFNFITEVYAKK